LAERDILQSRSRSDQMDSAEFGRVLVLLKKARHDSGRGLDFWADFTDGVDIKSLELLVSRASMISVKET